MTEDHYADFSAVHYFDLHFIPSDIEFPSLKPQSLALKPQQALEPIYFVLQRHPRYFLALQPPVTYGFRISCRQLLLALVLRY